MQLSTPIYVAGHRGLVGSAIVRDLLAGGYEHLITRTHAEVDLAQYEPTRQLMLRERPRIIFVAASKVGGICANNEFPADFLMHNLAVQLNIFRAAHEAAVERVIFLGSSCIYPRDVPQPMTESALLTGALEPTNRAYAIAKIAGVEMCWSFNRQHGHRWLAVMPANLYGPGDNYDLATAHVLPALLRKTHEAHVTGEHEVMVWGTGEATREFLYVDDLARALVLLAMLPDAQYGALVDPQTCPTVNVGSGVEQSIGELAAMIVDLVGFEGIIAHDRTRPDGTPRRVIDSSRMRALGWQPRVGLRDGLGLAYHDYVTRIA